MTLHKANNPYLATFLIKTLIFEWYVVSCGYENEYQQDMCLKEINLGTQNTITILDSIVNITQRTYMTVL
jgi:hypothetical protein